MYLVKNAWIGRTVLRGLFLVACVVFLGGSARADALDEVLNQKTPEVVRYLRANGFKAAGVLRFRVKEGDCPESFQAGPINGNLVERLENALILHMGSDERQAVAVIHDAGKEAALRRIVDWYGNPADRQRLFDISTYARAWGDRRLKADVFLTGVLRMSRDLKRATLTVEAFRAAAPARREKVADLCFDTDLPLLRDLGKSFRLARRGRLTGARRRDLAIEESQQNDLQPAAGGSVTIDGIEFNLLSDGQPAGVRNASDGGGSKMEVVCPEAGKPVVFTVRNTTDKKLGVDVKVNGRSLLFEQTDEAEKCRVWVLDPGKSYQLKGWYLNEEGQKNVAPFKVLVGDEARQMKEQLGARAGDIDVSVFESTDEPAGDEPTVSRGLRGLPGRKDKEARKTYASYRRALLHASKQKVKTVGDGKSLRREILVADTDEQARADQKLRAVDFPNRKPLGNVSIKVLPRSQGDTE